MKFAVFILFLVCSQASAQEKGITTDHFVIEGKVKLAVEVSVKDILSMPAKHMDSFVVRNHLMQKKFVLKNLDVVALKTILSKVMVAEDDLKKLSEYYFVFVASDNYKVVYSWNELFNSPTGKNVYLIRSADGSDLPVRKDAISVICLTDSATGRRYVKGLQKIVVERIQ